MRHAESPRSPPTTPCSHSVAHPHLLVLGHPSQSSDISAIGPQAARPATASKLTTKQYYITQHDYYQDHSETTRIRRTMQYRNRNSIRRLSASPFVGLALASRRRVRRPWGTYDECDSRIFPASPALCQSQLRSPTRLYVEPVRCKRYKAADSPPARSPCMPRSASDGGTAMALLVSLHVVVVKS